MTIKTIAVMKSCATKILRINDREMAHFVSEFRKAVKYGIESWDSYAGRVIDYDQIKRVKFINERTKECILEY